MLQGHRGSRGTEGGDTAAAKGEGPWMMMTMDAEDGCVLLFMMIMHDVTYRNTSLFSISTKKGQELVSPAKKQ